MYLQYPDPSGKVRATVFTPSPSSSTSLAAGGEMLPMFGGSLEKTAGRGMVEDL